ncbi:DUF4747 family protein [Pectobacterium polaris]|uniref:DUF4747 family protein n=1 Tax=Pectobacterium polaris TaxID=2042057 RepID=UPI001CC3535A|nr:DUF4747 family protein [Pectobacterium polaris]UAY92600.1 DUF4747 family protein [Pectobacterium polaris]
MRFNLASFIFYNIQLLPKGDVQEVGVKGYKKLFTLLRDVNNARLKEKSHLSYHHSIGRNTYFGPHEFFSEIGGVNGFFVKYKDTDNIVELLTDRVILNKNKQPTAVYDKKKIPFIFDASNHILAIERDAAPADDYSKLQDILCYFLKELAERDFKDYELTINLISLPSDLDDIFQSAISYKNVEINIVAPNGDSEDILDEMKSSKMQKLKINASAGSGNMNSIPKFINNMLRAAQTHGSIKLRYLVKADGSEKELVKTYDSEKSPLSIKLRHSKTDTTERSFLRRCSRVIKETFKRNNN